MLQNMQKVINLKNKELSEIPYDIVKFPDGEVQIRLTEELNRKSSYLVITKITSAEELFILLQLGDILDRHEVLWKLYITYLMSQRMDRVMNFNYPFSLKIVFNCLNTLKCTSINVLSPHSDRMYWLSNNFYEVDFNFGRYIDRAKYTLCYPDAGAAERYKHVYIPECYGDETIILDKKRDIITGNILNLDFINKPSTVKDRILIVDDLCDGGGTFLMAHKLLKEAYPNTPIDICVTHIVNPIGFNNLCNTFNKVYYTNSYTEYEHRDNATIIDVSQFFQLNKFS